MKSLSGSLFGIMEAESELFLKFKTHERAHCTGAAFWTKRVSDVFENI